MRKVKRRAHAVDVALVQGVDVGADRNQGFLFVGHAIAHGVVSLPGSAKGRGRIAQRIRVRGYVARKSLPLPRPSPHSRSDASLRSPTGERTRCAYRRHRNYAAFHSCMPSAALLIGPLCADRRPVEIEQARQRRLVACRHARQRTFVVLGAQDDDAVLGRAVAIVDHGEALDLAVAAGLGIELRRLAAVLVGDRLNAGAFRQRLRRRMSASAPARGAW